MSKAQSPQIGKMSLSLAVTRHHSHVQPLTMYKNVTNHRHMMEGGVIKVKVYNASKSVCICYAIQNRYSLNVLFVQVIEATGNLTLKCCQFTMGRFTTARMNQ